MTDRPLTDFGVRLRHAREARGISLRQVSNVTRISVRALEAVERNDLSRLPGGIFTRSFVRAYAAEVGLDPEATLRDFLSQCPQDASALPVSGTDIVDGGGNTGVEGLGARLATLAVLLLVVAGAGAYGVVRWSAARQPASAEAAAHEPSTPAEARAHSGPVATTDVPAANGTGRAENPTAAAPPVEAVVRAVNVPTVPAPPAAPLTIRLVAQTACWVSAQPDQGAKVERLLAPGDHLELTAERNLALKVGDAGALTLTINGRAARPLGASGEVVAVQLSPETAPQFLVP